MDREAWIIDAVRSSRGKGKESGALHNVHPQRILAQVKFYSIGNFFN